MVLPELRSLAGELGIKGASGMRKGDLISAIKERQGGGPAREASASESPQNEQALNGRPQGDAAPSTQRDDAGQSDAANDERGASNDDGAKADKADAGNSGQEPGGDADASNESDGQGRNRNRNRNRNREGGDGGGQNKDKEQKDGQGGQNQGGQGGGQNRNRDEDGEGGGRNRRNRRFRERNRRGGGRDRDGEPQLSEDDVVAPVAGILDVLDNYAFVRTSGYLAGPNDVYVSMNLVRRNGLRRGDAITGAVKVPRDGEQGGGGNQGNRQKFNPLVRLDTVNGTDPETARKRPDFNKLTPLYPNERLRLETTSERLDTRVIDLIMPIGKGQRALIVSPPKAGKTTILQDIANAIATNNPECHLMVVLVDERPEEVTDMQRSVKGEVIASTFDRPPSDHTSVSELAIERAKRLVEQGKDVVVLLDSITRLGRAYNNASPASGRILSGGVDSTALYPPKRFLGAARNIENGGSLTIIASALVETGSTGDTVIFEEFKGTGNAELKLDRKIAERRVFPAVDVNLSSTRKDELLLSPEEFSIVHKLRRVLSGLDSHQAIDLLISQLKKTKNNVEFLMQVQKNTPGAMNDDD
nr:transcription termination factor Rho [Gordonia araii]